MKQNKRILIFLFVLTALASPASAQQINRAFSIREGGRIEVVNLYGRVQAATETAPATSTDTADATEAGGAINVNAVSSSGVLEDEVKFTENGNNLQIEVTPKDTKKRVDISIMMPSKTRLKVETRDGEVRVSGNVVLAEVLTDTGTIAADVPTENLKYEFHWNASRPRFLSDTELAEVKERSGGRFEITGRIREQSSSKPKKVQPEADAAEEESTEPVTGSVSVPASTLIEKKSKPKSRSPETVSLNFTTERGIILLNIPPNEVSSDLRERPLTTAAKSIIRSGDSLLMEAIRRAAPKYYGDYARTLPPAKLEPSFAERGAVEKGTVSSIKAASVRVNDLNNRAIAGLRAADFELLEDNVKREVVSVEPASAPFNLVLLLDVSGSVNNYVNFIRKAARNFVETVNERDRISIVTFNDDVKVLSRFTTDKRMLSESLDTFDAGGATAYYDALAYTLADTLRPLKGERTAIVILTDGDDNRSFLPFDSMLSSIQESGALIYPLYVPSGLIAASESGTTNSPVDALRSRYLQGELTSKAKVEGERLAKVSGGVYFPITQLSQIQTAYEEIASQLRTAYTVNFRSDSIENGSGASPRIKVRIKKPNAFATVSGVTSAN